MDNLIFNTRNYSPYEKKILGIMIERNFTMIDDEYCNDECNKCSINHLCNDLHNTLKTLSESGFILKFQSKNCEKSIDITLITCYNKL